jgi:hypothetical protein
MQRSCAPTATGMASTASNRKPSFPPSPPQLADEKKYEQPKLLIRRMLNKGSLTQKSERRPTILREILEEHRVSAQTVAFGCNRPARLVFI